MIEQADVWSQEIADAPRPPLANGLPLLGNALDLSGDIVGFLMTLYRELGPIFRVRALNRRYTVLAGPEANRFLAQTGSEYLRTKEFWDGFGREMNAERFILNSDGGYHTKLRKVLKRGYSRTMITDHFPLMIDVTQKELRTLERGQRVQVVPFMRWMAIQQLGKLTASVSTGDYFDDFLIFLKTIVNITVIGRMPNIFLAHPIYRRAKRRVLEFGEQVIEQHRKTKRVEPDLIDDILAAADQDPALFGSKEEMMMAVLGPFIAGLDTTADTCAFMLYALLKNPDVMEQVVAEVDAVFAHGNPTPEQFRHMPVLHAAAMETMRMYPVAPATQRTATRDFVFAGHHVEEGEDVLIPTTLTHWLPDYFPQPDTFDIGRYSAPRSEHKQKGVYAPYGLGSHTCLGAGMAEVQVALTMALLLRSARFELAPADYQLKIVNAPTPTASPGFQVKVTDLRQNAVVG